MATSATTRTNVSVWDDPDLHSLLRITMEENPDWALDVWTATEDLRAMIRRKVAPSFHDEIFSLFQSELHLRWLRALRDFPQRSPMQMLRNWVWHLITNSAWIATAPGTGMGQEKRMEQRAALGYDPGATFRIATDTDELDDEEVAVLVEQDGGDGVDWDVLEMEIASGALEVNDDGMVEAWGIVCTPDEYAVWATAFDAAGLTEAEQIVMAMHLSGYSGVETAVATERDPKRVSKSLSKARAKLAKTHSI